MALLGAIMVDREIIGTARETVRPSDFYGSLHEMIYAAALALHDRGDPIDKISVAEELRHRGMLDQVGGMAFLSSLLDAVPSASSADYYAKLIVEKATLRALIAAGVTIAEFGYEGEHQPERAVERASAVLSDTRRPATRAEFSFPIESAAEIARTQSEPVDFDVDGMLPAEDAPALVFGPPASLKSWLIMHLCHAIVTGQQFLGQFKVRRRQRALYLNLDAGAKTFRNRIRRISSVAGFDLVSIPSGQFSLDLLRSYMSQYRGAIVVIDCLSSIYNPDRTKDPAFAMREFVDGLRALYAEFECGGVMIDHPHRPKERGEIGDYHGSIQKEAAFRSMWSVSSDPADDSGGPRRVKITCRKLSEGQPFAPVHVLVDFSKDLVGFTTAAVDPETKKNETEARMIEWGLAQMKTFSRSGCVDALTGVGTDAKRKVFDGLVKRSIFVETNEKKGGFSRYRHASTTWPDAQANSGQIGQLPRVVSDDLGRPAYSPSIGGRPAEADSQANPSGRNRSAREACQPSTDEAVL